MNVTPLEHEMSKFTHGKAGGIRRLQHRWQRTVGALGDYLEGVRVQYYLNHLYVS